MEVAKGILRHLDTVVAHIVNAIEDDMPNYEVQCLYVDAVDLVWDVMRTGMVDTPPIAAKMQLVRDLVQPFVHPRIKAQLVEDIRMRPPFVGLEEQEALARQFQRSMDGLVTLLAD